MSDAERDARLRKLQAIEEMTREKMRAVFSGAARATTPSTQQLAEKSGQASMRRSGTKG